MKTMTPEEWADSVAGIIVAKDEDYDSTVAAIYDGDVVRRRLVNVYRAAIAAIAAERKACARLVETNLPDHTLCEHEGAECFAAAIRALTS